MTSTTAERDPQPWPTRREREGGVRASRREPDRRGRHAAGLPRPDAHPAAAPPALTVPVTRPPSPAAPAPVPTASAPDTDATERLPIVVPHQRRGEPGVPSRPAAPAPPAPLPAARPVPAAPPAPFPIAPAASTAPSGMQHRTGPPPPRPAVGNAAPHRVDGRVRDPRNELGVAALAFALVGLPFGLVPVTGFLAAGMGALAVAFGLAGWLRTRAGSATNRGSSLVGGVLGTVVLALGLVGTVVFFQNPDRLVYDVGSFTASAVVASATPIGE